MPKLKRAIWWCAAGLLLGACGAGAVDEAATTRRTPDASPNEDDAQRGTGSDARPILDAGRDARSREDASTRDGSRRDASTSDGSTTDAGIVLDVVATRRIGTGWWTTCAVRGAGALYCWGYNGTGGVGDGTKDDRHVPVLVSGLGPTAQVAVGAYSTCALSTAGTVSCWGARGYGEMGNGVANAVPQLTPTPVAGLTDVVELSGGAHHFCVRKSDDSLWCWGYSHQGAVGDGQFSDVRPVAKILDSVAQVSASTYHTCARMRDGTAKCWGDNVNGCVGTGTTTVPYATPQTVANLTNVVQVGSGALHSCALLADQTARCWGDNAFGELGDGTQQLRPSPVAVTGLTGLVQVAPGGPGSGYLVASCALRGNGTVACWGANGYGEIGDGTTTSSFVPVNVPSLSDVVELAAGGGHACVQRSDDSLWCWGLNAYGEIGDGTTTNALAPVQVF